jgi:hypothetical protein
MKPGSSLPPLQVPATYPYPDTEQSNHAPPPPPPQTT